VASEDPKEAQYGCSKHAKNTQYECSKNPKEAYYEWLVRRNAG
jgi:hypothetical protein